MVNFSLNLVSSSRCHWVTRLAGATIRVRVTSLSQAHGENLVDQNDRTDRLPSCRERSVPCYPVHGATRASL
jgi:hypothetical protein